MLSLTCKTAIKAVIYLALKHGTGVNAGIREIAEDIRANEHTVGKLLQTLVKHGVVNSVKGPSGGFHISKEQLRLPVIHIVEAIDGPRTFTECGLGLSKCSATHPCPIHHEYKAARDLIGQLCRSKKIAELCEPVNNGLAYLTG